MRRIACLIGFIFSVISGFAQNVGIGTNTPQAALDVTSTTNGFLPPRMTFAQRNAIVNPAEGLMIYCTDCDSSGQPQFFNGTRWCNMLGGIATGILVADLPSVTIGTQIWSNKNLSVARYRNADPIPQVTDPTQWANLTTGAWCWYNNDSATYAATYGRLYNWYAVNDPRGLAPQGWRIPTEGDWNRLVRLIDNTADTTCIGCEQSYTAGGSMKSTTGWNVPNTGANNSTGFTGLGGGYRYVDGSYENIGVWGIWWSAEAFDAAYAYRHFLNFSDAKLYKNYFNKTLGFSVRVVRDTTISLTTPMLTTTAATSITTTSATSGGNITNDGGAYVMARGIVWSTSPNPTVELSTKTIDGAGIGVFTSIITGLTPNTTYYVRAYATNSEGTAYGAEVTFTTFIIPPVDTTITSVTIGTQIWSNKNLIVARYRNGDPIPQVTDPIQWANLTTDAWCWYNNDSATYAATYGRLYNWYALNDPRGLAPQGWRIPTEGDWNRLVKFIDPATDTTCQDCAQSSTAGGAMKSTTGWDAPNTGATNSSGFAGLPGGIRSSVGTFDNVGILGFWWSAGEFDTSSAWNRNLFSYNSIVGRSSGNKTNGVSVRVVRD